MVLLDAFQREHPHAHVADNDRHAAHYVRHRHTAHRIGGWVERQPAIHFLVGDRVPLVAPANFGALIGRGIKPFRKRAVDVRIDHMAVASLP